MLESEMLNSFLVRFLNHQIKIKMLHFQTKSYGTHKATDDYLVKFATNFDRFMEVAQGISGKIDLKNIKFNIDLLNDQSVEEDLKTFRDVLISLELPMNDDINSDLITIRDEMLADLNQLIYLLTFK
jgi:hypothetical protein